MKKDILLVIDMQNVYGQGGAWCCHSFGKAAENILKLIRDGRDSFDVIFTRFLADDGAEGAWRDYNRENADINSDAIANEMAEILKGELENYPLYSKSVYSSLAIPDVKKAVCKADRVLLSGVVAECCVLSTAFAAIDEGAQVIYLRDCVSGLDQVTEKAVETVLSGLVPLQVRIMTGDEYLLEKRNAG